MNNGQFLALVDEIRIRDFSLSSTEAIVKKINKLFLAQGVASIEEEALKDKIETLSKNAKEALLQVLKDANVAAVLNIVGMKPSMKRGMI